MTIFSSLVCILLLSAILNIELISGFRPYNMPNSYQTQEPATYKLSYFDLRFRAEFIRWMFAFSNQTYADNRINTTSWPALKSSFTFEQVPVLEVKKNGRTLLLSQSLTIGISKFHIKLVYLII